MADAQTTIVGNVTRDPELRYAQTGTAILTLGVAVNHRRQVNGEWETETSFVDVTCFKELAENLAESVVKGTRIIATGRLQVRTYERRDGATGTAVEVIADAVGPDLRWATAVVSKTGGRSGQPAATPETTPVGSAYASDEEPF